MTNKQRNTALAVGGGIALIIVLNKIFGKSDEEKAIEEITKLPPGDNSNVAMVNGVPFTMLEARSIADTLYQAMEDCGTDEDVILATLSQGYNGKALQMIYKAYGLKRSGYVLGCHGNVAVGGTIKDLGGWLREELAGEPQLDAVRTIFKKANIVIWTRPKKKP